MVKSHSVALMDIRHIQKYEYILENIRESNLKCENYQNVNWDNKLTKWLTVVINEKLREWIQNHPPVQVPSLNISEHLIWILISRGLWIAVHLCAKRKKTSIICVGISRIRLARFEQRWNEDESSSVHRETVAFTMRVNPSHFEKQQRQQRQQQSYVNTSENKVKLKKRKESFEKTKLGLWFLDDIDVTVKKREQRIGRVQNPKN